MKFKITFKDPDGVSDSIQNAIDRIPVEYRESEASYKLKCEEARIKMLDTIAKYVRHEEYITNRV